MHGRPFTQFLAIASVISASIIAFPNTIRAEHAEPPLPPILENLHSKSSKIGNDCFQKEDAIPPNKNPEFTHRLVTQFPLGSNEKFLTDSLTGQGFSREKPRKNFPLIHSMSFSQHRVKDGGISEWLFSLTYTMNATVYWKVGPNHTIVCIIGETYTDGL